MTFLPVVQRELRVAARRRMTFWGRSLAALVAIIAGAWIYIAEDGSPMSAMGMTLFATLSGFVFVHCLFAGMMYSADSVSAEKREGTLGLLFLTDLRGYDVVLGKLAASSVAALYRVLAVLPIIAIALLLGGVTATEYWRMVVVLLTTLFLSLGAGMVASVASVQSKTAAGLTFLFLACACFLGLLLLLLAAWLLPKVGWAEADVERKLEPLLFWESPVIAFITSFATFPSTHRWAHYPAVGWTAGLALVFLAVASWRLPQSWQDRAIDERRRGFRAKLERRWLRGDAGRDAVRARLLAAGPICWLNGRHVGRPFLVWGALAAIAAIYVCFGAEVGWREPSFHIALSLGAHFVLKFWVASEAPRRFFEDRRSKAMELYLSTPLTVPEIIRQQFRSLRRLFLAPIAAVLLADAIFLWLAGRQGGDDASFINYWLIRVLFLPFDTYTMAYVGMWLGISTTSARTTGGVVWRVLVLPWIVCVGLVTLGVVGQLWRVFEHLPVNGGLIGLWAWFAIGALNNLYWLFHSRRALHEHFRELAALPPGSRHRRSWWPFRRPSAHPM